MKLLQISAVRVLLFCALALIFATAVTMRVSASRSARGAPGSVTITFWQSTNPQESAFTQLLVNSWNKTHRDIYINLQYIPAGTSTEEVFDAAVAAHRTPDITNNLLPAVVPQYASEGGLYELDKLPDFVSYMTARMPTGTLQQFKSNDGHYYQVPWKANPVMIIYRPDLLKKAGIPSFPRTYSAFITALKAIKSKTGVNPLFPDTDPTWSQRFFDFYPFYLAQAGGTTLLNKDATKAIFQEHNAARVLDLWRQIFNDGLAPKSTSTADKWSVGHQAMMIAGPWGPNGEIFQHNAGKIPWAVAPIPVPDSMAAPAYPYTFSDPKNITIFGTCTHPRQAWQFVKWYINSANDAAFLQATWEFPFRKALVANPTGYSTLFRQYPQLIQFAKQLPHIRGLDDTPSFVQVLDAVSSAWEAASVNNSGSPRAAIQRAAHNVDDIVKAGP